MKAQLLLFASLILVFGGAEVLILQIIHTSWDKHMVDLWGPRSTWDAAEHRQIIRFQDGSQ